MKGIRNSFFALLLVFVSCPVFGQVTQRQDLTESDYSQWSTMRIRNASVNGSWISYKISSESGCDTLFVRNKSTAKIYAFPKGIEGKFVKENLFACNLPKKKLALLQLATGLVREVDSIAHAEFSSDGSYLITLSIAKKLVISQIDGTVLSKYDDVNAFYMNPQSNAMIFTTENKGGTAYYTDFRTKKLIVSDGMASLDNIVWQGNGQSAAFIKRYSDSTDVRNGQNLFLYRLNESRLYTLDMKNYPVLKEGYELEAPNWTRFNISEDGKRIFFYFVEKPVAKVEKSPVQVWHSDDNWTFSQLQREGSWNKGERCAVWFIDDGHVLKIGSKERPMVMLSGDQRYVVTWNPVGSKPQFTFYSATDFYVTDLATGKESLVLKNQVCDMSEITVSVGGRYLCYRKDNHWQIYEFATGQHFDLSSRIPASLSDSTYDRTGIRPLYGIAGWTKKDKSILLYDQFDLWEVHLRSNTAKRLTKGREQNIQFRIAPAPEANSTTMNFSGSIYPLLILENGIYLKAYNDSTKQSGFYFWNGTEEPVVFGDRNFKNLQFSAASTIVYFMEEDFDLPPSVGVYDRRHRIKETVVKSNLQQELYHWGYSKLLNYNNSQGKALQAALYYPANYDSSKKYPMVVYIYEKLSKYLHEYENPTLSNGAGINFANLTSQGYFVLCPDITYEADKVGLSAADCVVSATKSLLAKGIIDASRIALVGHSFGGYEVNFIATQTEIFTTFISGAGVSDFVNAYLSIGWNNGRPEVWRYEGDMMRMSKSLFENRHTYLENSPITHAENIKSPMLLWTGEDDLQVHYLQTTILYNALRRLGKKAVMLVYPETRHSLLKKNLQEDYTHRFEEWLSVYLKGTPMPQWMMK